MTFRLNNKWRDILARLPESSMGAQHVDLILNNGRVIEDVTVFNGEDGTTTVEFDPATIVNIRMCRR